MRLDGAVGLESRVALEQHFSQAGSSGEEDSDFKLQAENSM